MRIVDALPHQIEEIEHCWIALADGTRLAARVWLPATAGESPVPAILESVPYRKRDGTRIRDETMHRYFAGHGYAAVRIDVRGSGESDGVLIDEYLEQEQRDGKAAVEWVAAQPWCSGAVGMIGKSWGGFSALQVAALAPPALKAIISVCAADDRYADDAHYMGGCLLNENLLWGANFVTLNAQAPDPDLVGERWREMWLERLKATPFFSAIWLAHQRRDDYWRQGSVCENLAHIRCPVYAVSGWADGYSNAVPRLLAGLRGPRKGLVGPWAHVYPHEGVPGPAIGFLQEALRWWDHWLRDVDTGITDEPEYRVWMQNSAPPRSFYEQRSGRWVAEDHWPSPGVQSTGLSLAPGRLLGPGDPLLDVPPVVTHRSPQTVGLAAGSWCGFGVVGEMPTDQRADDGKSLCFDTAPLSEGIEILGPPIVRLRLAVDRPNALIAVRLNDLAPGGSSTRVTFGLLNLCHRNGHERPEPMPVGEEVDIEVQLNDIAHVFPVGHRVRLAISTSYWPMAWPSPQQVTLMLDTAHSVLELPVRPPRASDAELRPFAPPESAGTSDATDLHPGGIRRTVEHDLATGVSTYLTTIDVDESGDVAMTRYEPIGLESGQSISERFRIVEGEPLRAEADIEHTTVRARPATGWSTRVVTRTRLTASVDQFHLEGSIEAWDGDERFFSTEWQRSIDRDHV